MCCGCCCCCRKNRGKVYGYAGATTAVNVTSVSSVVTTQPTIYQPQMVPYQAYQINETTSQPRAPQAIPEPMYSTPGILPPPSYSEAVDKNQNSGYGRQPSFNPNY